MAEVEANGLRFHVQRLGAGPRTAVFLHGLVMDNLSSWYFSVANSAAQKADVVLYDLRGHGRSERPSSGYGLDEMVADLEGILDAQGIDGPVDLIGNSYGGLLALAFAFAHPERTGGLLLADPHLITEGWGDLMKSTLHAQGDEAVDLIAKNFATWKGRHSERKRNKLLLTARDLIYGTSLVADLEAAAPFSDEALAAISCPVLCLFGEHSDIREQCEPRFRRVPMCEVRIFPGCTHSILWEATAELKDLVVNWVGRPV